MGKVTNQITKIQIKENLTLPQVFEKYPHLSELQLEEILEEENMVRENKKLILG